jgi:hypothetical protein
MLKITLSQSAVTSLNVYTLNNRAPETVKLNEETEKSTMI